ncbi:MAG TPA: N-acetyl-gamma-glutamyl-phosphate reductase [Candidatus Limnocylindrales bacterium]|nr:N-acetyl-gamma-glutamyl-phosphate reductase [Candidatus Limnocylindrales bacterium]
MAGATLIRVAVVGATGYSGAELVRLLSRHPNVQLTVVTSEQAAGAALGSVHRTLAFTGLSLEAVDAAAIAPRADIAFTALPHGASTPVVAALVDRGVRVVDVGADFRFQDVELYTKWYGQHGEPQLAREAVYGLTEFAREQVAGARLVANPGCYPTGALMGLIPLAAHIRGPVFVDSKSGTSGAGRGAKVDQLFAEVTENIRPYSVGRHRHQPEIASQLSAHAGEKRQVVFSPHLLPVARGLQTTMYLDIPEDVDVGELLHRRYDGEPFVRLLEGGAMPEPRAVRGTNMIEIAWLREPDSGRVVVLTAIDNLGKGAAGQAVQNMNCMIGAPETSGLDLLPALP